MTFSRYRLVDGLIISLFKKNPPLACVSNYVPFCISHVNHFDYSYSMP
jgi:hypothetical protein